MAILACNAAILVFVGLPGLLMAVIILLALWLRGHSSQTRGPGGATLLWLPLLYALILLPLANWLVMGDTWFWLRRLGPFLAQMPPGAWWPREDWYAWGLTLLLVLVLVGTCWRRLPRRWYLAWLLIPAQGILLNLGQAAELHLGPEQLMGTLLAPTLVLACLAPSSGGLRGGRAWLAALLSLPFIVLSCQWRGPAGTRENFMHGPPAPPATELLACADANWTDSRILIFDLRTAALYVHQAPNRFVARLDFHESELLDFKDREELHLLIAPNDGRFQARDRSMLSYLHEHGAPWLFLEREWPGGWQLWHCVRPPPEERTAAPTK